MTGNTYSPTANRYEKIQYNRCGRSGIKLPAISLGLWHNFGDVDDFSVSRDILRYAFDSGITHFDLANNYGPPYGTAEKNFGKVMDMDFRPYRDEMIISSKAGYDMWPGPYGNWGSRKYLIASLDQSLKRLGLDYVDIFYHHRPDPETPLEETMGALSHIVQKGKALYAGISNYPAHLAKNAIDILKRMGTPCLIHQPRYSMLDRWVEDSLLEILGKEGVGTIVFSPLSQGLLTDKYLHGIPNNSRAAKKHGHLQQEKITDELVSKINKLNDMAGQRGQSLAQMAIAWLLKDQRITSVLVGARTKKQLKDNLGALHNLDFNQQEIDKIEDILAE